MINDDKILENKNRFIDLLMSVKREGSNIDGLINKLENSDFFTAPASTNYHSAYKGGLCEHCLNVYDQLDNLIKMEYKDNECPYSKETLIIVALLHDISKMNFYEVSERNTKDINGNWVKVPFYKVREKRFLYSTHGVNSEYIVGHYIPLTIEESAAIVNHMGGKEPGAPTIDNGLSEIFNHYPLAILLHTADMLATFFVEALAE